MAKRAVVNYVGSSGTGVTDGDKGDIVVSASGATWTLQAFADVSGDSLNLEDSLTFTGSTYSPTGNSQTIDLATDQMPFLELNQGSGGGTLTLTIEPPDGRAEGKLVIHQHASSIRDIEIESTGATIAHVGTQRAWTSDATGSYIVVGWNYDGTRLFIDSGGSSSGTNLSTTTTTTSVTVVSNTGNDATIAAVNGSAAGVMTSAMLSTLNGACQATGVGTTTHFGIVISAQTWNDGVDDWEVGQAILAANEASSTRTQNELLLSGDLGALLRSGTTTIGVVDDIYVVSDASLFRSTIGLGSMATQASTAYLALSGGTLTGGITGTGNVIEQRNGTSAQTLRVYGTFTDASNYVRAALTSNGTSSITLAAETAGTGADNIDVVLEPAGTGIVTSNVSPTTATHGFRWISTTAYGTRFETSVADQYNEFRSSSGDGQFGIYNDALYFQPNTTLANGTTFLTGSGSTAIDVRQTGSVAVGLATRATNATAGFLYVPTCAGTPTGAPTAITGFAPIVIDSTNNKLYFYSGGSWRDAGP